MRYFLLSVFFILTFSLTAQDRIGDEFPYVKGSLRFDKDFIKLDYVKSTEVRYDTLRYINTSGRAIEISARMLPAWLKFTFIPAILNPSQVGYLAIAFDAPRKGDYGTSYDGVQLQTTDTLEPVKSFYIMSYIEEDFSGLSPQDRQNAPVIRFNGEEYNYGYVQAGTKVNFSFRFTNAGKSDLIIRKVKPSCGCTATEPKKTRLMPGESSEIDVIFDSSNMKGEQNKSIFVFSNDPRYPAVTLRVVGKVY